MHGGKERHLSAVTPMFPEARQHRPNPIKTVHESCNRFTGCISFILAHFQPQFHFIAGADRHLQVTLELRRRIPLRPSLHDIRRYRSRRSAQLSGKLELLETRKALRQFRDIQRRRIRFAKNIQVSISANRHGVPFSLRPCFLPPCLFYTFAVYFLSRGGSSEISTGSYSSLIVPHL